MAETPCDPLLPLAGRDDEPAFDELWQAQVLAIADNLVETGMFATADWSRALGEALRDAERRGEADDQQTYYRAALQALETLVANHSAIDLAAMAQTRADWEAAYLRTPHGRPVELKP